MKTHSQRQAAHEAKARRYQELSLLASNERLRKLKAIVRAFDRWMDDMDEGDEVPRSGHETDACVALADLYKSELAKLTKEKQ